MTFTLVKSEFRADSRNHRLRFGAPVHIIRINKNSTYSAFKPGDVFGYIRWNRNDYGTINWQFIIGRSGSGASLTRFPGIHPGADLLYRARGVKAVKETLSWLDRLEKTSITRLEDYPISLWRKAENQRIIRAKLPLYKVKSLELFHV